MVQLIPKSFSRAIKVSQTMGEFVVLNLNFSFHAAESEELFSEESEEISEAIRKRSRKA